MINIFQTQLDEIWGVLEDARQIDAENHSSNTDPGKVFMRAVSAEQAHHLPQVDDLSVLAALRFVLTSDPCNPNDRLYRHAVRLRGAIDRILSAADPDALNAAQSAAQDDMRSKNLDPFDRADVLKYIRARFEQ